MSGVRLSGVLLLWTVLCSCHLQDFGRRKPLPHETNPDPNGSGAWNQAGQAAPSTSGDGTYTMDVNMPGVRPDTDDAYLCTSVSLLSTTQYIINYKAVATVPLVHHLLLYGCGTPAVEANQWKCGMTCKRQPKILYAWAKNASPTHLPPDVGYQVGGSTGINYLVLQIHYRSRIPPSEPADHSGVHLTLTQKKQTFISGVYLMALHDINIPPRVSKLHGDISCKYKGRNPLHAFAFRVHAHKLSTVISAYQNNGTWSLIGKGNPQWPQAFYPVPGQNTIKPGDILAARCTYDSTTRQTATRIGGAHSDEMCNFYMMYYTNASAGGAGFLCDQNNFPEMFNSLPPGNDVPLPPNPLLEEVAAHSLQGVHESSAWPVITPADHLTIGQVGGLATDSHGNVHVFHRGSRSWKSHSFDTMNRFADVKAGPIKENTIVTFSPDGKVIRQWGANMFYMPHGLHIDHEDNIWVTDVALHQVMKFPAGSHTATLVLGTKLTPGGGDKHYCKPSDVATLTTGEFYVTDGYCNHRVIKYTKEGTILKQWGERTKSVTSGQFPAPNAFDIPHSITALEDHGWVCVADRENGRIQCFTLDGAFVKQLHPRAFNGRLYAVAYSAATGVLYAVNGPDLYGKKVAVLGFSLDPDSGNLLETWQPQNGLKNPHDVAVSPSGQYVYVGELKPHKVWRFKIQKQIVQALSHKKVGKLWKRPMSVDGGVGTEVDGDVEEESSAEQNDFGASMVIGALLIVPVIIIVAVTVFLRLRKKVVSARMEGYREVPKLTVDEFSDDEEEASLPS